MAQQICNVDEIELFREEMPNRTGISKPETTMPGFKAAKARLTTLLLAGNADGGGKLKLYLVYLSEYPRALQNISKATLSVYHRSHPKPRITTASPPSKTGL
jgi:hypothetical protein